MTRPILVYDPIFNSMEFKAKASIELCQTPFVKKEQDHALSLIGMSIEPILVSDIINHASAQGVTGVRRFIEHDASEYEVVEIYFDTRDPSLNHDFVQHSRLVARANEVEVNVLNPEQQMISYGLACFDMDSTLIEIEVIDELAKYAGVGEQVAQITERAMRGELDFNQSFSARLNLLNGLDSQVIDDLGSNLPLSRGAQNLFRHLHRQGVKTAILSGGFTPFATILKHQLAIDTIVANTLETKAGRLTGQVIQPIVNANFKAKQLEALCSASKLDLRNTIAVGDGANDLLMLDKAGFGCAYHAKPVVRESADFSINFLGLDSILPMLGIHQ